MNARRRSPLGVVVLSALVFVLATSPAIVLGTDESEPAEEKKKKGGRFKDPEDGKFDLTAGGNQGAGFLPIALPFNDPAVGFGLALAVAYFHPQKDAPADSSKGSAAPPTATFGAVTGTTNQSWFVAGGHHHVWKQDKIRYLGAVGGGSIHLTYFGLGDEGTSGDQGIDFNIEVLGLVQQVKFRIGKSPVFVGARYIFAGTETTFDQPVTEAESGKTDLAGLSALAEYDTRDTVFTPNRGLLASVDFGWFSEALGGDFDYGSVVTNLRYYWPVADQWVLGFRGDYDVIGDDAPFYALSFVQLRGVPIFRYIGNYMVTVEVEPRYKIDQRWSVLAFAGAGRAARNFSNLDDADRAYGFGAGFRYLLARKLGLAGGVDLARGPEDSVVYLTVGSAW